MNKKGFTLAEMLIVVAIIAVLVAIVTAVLTTKLELAREATDLQNIKSAISELQSIYYFGEYDKTKFSVYNSDNQKYARTYVKCVSTKSYWQTKGLTLSGNACVLDGALLSAPRTAKPYVRIRINMSTGQIDFNAEASVSSTTPTYNR